MVFFLKAPSPCGSACCGLVCGPPCGSPMSVANFAMACQKSHWKKLFLGLRDGSRKVCKKRETLLSRESNFEKTSMWVDSQWGPFPNRPGCPVLSPVVLMCPNFSPFWTSKEKAKEDKRECTPFSSPFGLSLSTVGSPNWLPKWPKIKALQTVLVDALRLSPSTCRLKGLVAPVTLELPGVLHVKLPLTRYRATGGCSSYTCGCCATLCN